MGELQYRNPELSRVRRTLDQMMQGGAMIAPAFGQFGALALLGMILVRNAAQNKDFTVEERLLKADARALSYMASAGYDPQGLVDILHKFLNAKDAVVPYFKDYYESRPITQERMFHLNRTFSELPLGDRSFSTEREKYLDMTKGVREIYR